MDKSTKVFLTPLDKLEKNREYRASHIQEINEAKRRRYHLNREKYLRRNLANYYANHAKGLEDRREYRRRNSDKICFRMKLKRKIASLSLDYSILDVSKNEKGVYLVKVKSRGSDFHLVERDFRVHLEKALGLIEINYPDLVSVSATSQDGEIVIGPGRDVPQELEKGLATFLRVYSCALRTKKNLR